MGEKILLVKIEQNGLSRPNNTKRAGKDQRIASQDQLKENRSRPGSSIPIFVSFLKKKLRFSRLLLEYRKSGEVPFSTEYLSDHLIDFFYKMKAFEFEIAPEQVRDFIKEKPQAEHLLISTEMLDRRDSNKLHSPILSRIISSKTKYISLRIFI